jgi:hypothetical protein
LRYWSKKFVAAAWGVCACMAVPGTPPGARADSTYFYNGNSYTSNNAGFVCLPGSLPCSPVPSPNAAADAAKFGTNLTSSVTFDFDTTGVTGSFLVSPRVGPSDITVQLTSGVYSASTMNFVDPSNYVTLTNGWFLTAVGVQCNFSSGPGVCAFTTNGGNPGEPFFSAGDNVQQLCSPAVCVAQSAVSSVPGIWSVPFPAIGSRPAGLALASGGLLGWWCRRRQKTA